MNTQKCGLWREEMTFEEDEIGGYCNPISDWDEYAEMWFMEGRNDI